MTKKRKLPDILRASQWWYSLKNYFNGEPIVPTYDPWPLQNGKFGTLDETKGSDESKDSSGDENQ